MSANLPQLRTETCLLDLRLFFIMSIAAQVEPFDTYTRQLNDAKAKAGLEALICRRNLKRDNRGEDEDEGRRKRSRYQVLSQ